MGVFNSQMSKDMLYGLRIYYSCVLDVHVGITGYWKVDEFPCGFSNIYIGTFHTDCYLV